MLDSSEAPSVLIRIAAGEYRLKRSLHINRSNVTVQGEAGARLVLANKVLAPVIAVGPQTKYPLESERIWNVAILDLEIDGNRENQASEYDRQLPWIRNNGIDVRTVTGLRVERVACGNNRSGGLVISWRCRDVVARDCVFENNFFDGEIASCELVGNNGGVRMGSVTAAQSSGNRVTLSTFADNAAGGQGGSFHRRIAA